MISYSKRFLVRLLLLSLVLAACFPAFATTFYVRQQGNDQADGKSPATAFKSVLRAAQVLNHTDAIVIGPGTYRTSALIADRFGKADARISITGDESGKLTGDAPGAVILAAPTAADTVFDCARIEHLTLSGFTFQGAGQGIKLWKCHDVAVVRCTFSQMTRGLVAESVEGLRVESCVYTRCTISMFIKSTVNARLAHNSVVASSSTGILLLSCGAGAIRNSLFAENNSNYVADAVSAATWSSDYNAISGASGPWGDGPTVLNIAEWFASSGQERHSIYVTPGFVKPDSYDLHIVPEVSWGGGLPGMTVGTALDPKVALDRDGKPFRTAGAGAYTYPDPVPAKGWKKLPVAMTTQGAGPRQSAGVYRADGTLLRTLLADVAGVRELWWNGLDDNGQPVAGGPLQVRSITHDVRMLDDGGIGDNGNPLGTYNPDNADRVVALPNGGFVVTTAYDEAGYPMRFFSASGQPVNALNLTEGNIWGLTSAGKDIIAGVGKEANYKLIRVQLPGARIPMANGAEFYPVLAAGERGMPLGMTVLNGNAYIALGDLNVVRVIDLATGTKKADWPVPVVGDIAVDPKGTLWVLSGKEIVSLNAAGQLDKHYASGLVEPKYLAAGDGRLAVIDRKWMKIALLDAATGNVIRTVGKDRTKEMWMPVSTDALNDPRGAAFLPDGKLLTTEHSRIRAFWPETGKLAFEAVSNFMETAVTHPTKPEYVYCGLGIFHVDPKTNAWEWLVETPTMNYSFSKEEDPWAGKRLGSPGQSVVLGGRAYIAYFNSGGTGRITLYDVTDPLRPRLALENAGKFNGWAYSTVCFTKDGDIVSSGNYTLLFTLTKFKGLDDQNNPVFDFAHPVTIGVRDDPEKTRGMKSIEALASDRTTGDIYYLAVAAKFNKMVPGWGADGTGVGKTAPDGTPKWFALSSGGNYMSISSARDAKQEWILAGKSFGGQLDVFDEDGLRVTTGNWGWASNYQMGFVDMRYGVHAYLRADGKVGVYIEDDAIGRFTRARMDGAETMQKKTTAFTWAGSELGVSPAPVTNQTEGGKLARTQVIPRVPELQVNGDWGQWEQNGVVPQIVALPSNVGFKRTIADDLMSTFRQGTYIGALAHDEKNLYAYFVATDDMPHFDAVDPNNMWMFDSFELWLEEEQFGLSLLKDGVPGFFKWRFHDKAGKEWGAGYALPRESVWAQKLTDLSSNPLGQQLAAITGASFMGKPGFAVMAKIPYEEVKLVGGYGSGRGDGVVAMTGAEGEVIRVAVSLNKIISWGRTQDYMIDWPSGKMYSDPTRSYPFVLGK